MKNRKSLKACFHTYNDRSLSFHFLLHFCPDTIPDKKKPTFLMPRPQLFPDRNMNTDNNLDGLERARPNSTQPPGEDSQVSFSVYKVRLSSSEACLPELRNSASAKGFIQNYRSENNMVPWYSRRIRALAAFLVLFIAFSLVMTGLFVWRVVYYGSKDVQVSTVNPPIKQVSC